jgi:hypothetical protein
VEQQVVTPVKQMLFTRLHVRSLLVLACCSYRVASLFLHIAQQVVQLRCLFLLEQILNLLAGSGQISR